MTHPRIHAASDPQKLAVVMSDGSSALTYGEMETRANQGAHFLRSLNIESGDSIAFWLPNCPEIFEVYWAGQRSGLYITPISTALNVDEADYIVENSGAKLIVGSNTIKAFGELSLPSGVTALTVEEWSEAISGQSDTPISDEAPGFHMVYSSGTTGRPKGVRIPLPEGGVTARNNLVDRIEANYSVGPADTYLSPAPLYHTAPLAYTTTCQRLGATVIQMPKFDAKLALEALEKYKITISQMVPTMFVRMLKLPAKERENYNLSALRTVIHAAAPCPVPIKHQMIEWFGPIIQEYYAGSEGNGMTSITSEEWLRKPGSVGRASWGSVHVCDEAGAELAADQQGLIYFEGGWDFQYHGDEKKTKDSRNPAHPGWSTLGDIGYLDEDGYLFLTDRQSHMIISGGVNIYPQEIENHLITHPKVDDVAVIGVPNEDFGEEVKAIVQPINSDLATPELANELLEFCRAKISHVKCPRSVDFDMNLPRQDNGKLYKRKLRDRYLEAANKPAS